MILAIVIAFVMSLIVMPIIIRIESNKERVFFIYAELTRSDIDDRKRNIRLFFAKLRQSTLNPGGSLFYEKSSRIGSSRLMTRRFSSGEPNASMVYGGGGGLSKISGGGNERSGLAR
jgi:hypothetical protein